MAKRPPSLAGTRAPSLAGLQRRKRRREKERKEQAAQRRERERAARAEGTRLSPSKRGYGRRWQRARAAHLQREPLCRGCAKRGRVTAATEVDHITPHRGDMKLFWDRSNWQSLCRQCHARKTAREDGGFGNPVRPVPPAAPLRG